MADEYEMPAPYEEAGDNGADLTPAASFWPIPWEWEISKWSGIALAYAARQALTYAEAVHDMDCEDRGLLFPNAIRERCADPLLLMRFLPHGITEPVRREAERMLAHG
ncbi:MAG: hypothetical protein QM605_14585 [Sphingobium sp.]